MVSYSRSCASGFLPARTTAWFAVIVMAGVWAPSADAAVACTDGVGQWRWFIGGEVTLSQGGGVRWVPATASIPPANGRWTCDPKTGKYVVTWQNGFVDSLDLSPDGTRLTGVSSTGVSVSGMRAKPVALVTPAGAKPGPAASAAPLAPVAPQTGGAIDHNPSVSEILKGRPKLDPSGWKQGSRPPQKGPKPFEGWPH